MVRYTLLWALACLHRSCSAGYCGNSPEPDIGLKHTEPRNLQRQGLGYMRLVETYEQVKKNARRFSKIGSHRRTVAYDRFAMFRHWYHFPELGESAFAPSKFIGYQGTTLGGYTGQGDGGQTETRLAQWFRKCQSSSPSFDVLYGRLEIFAESVGRNLNKLIDGGSGGIHVLDNMYPDETNLTEGAKKTVTVNAYERDRMARMKCIELHGYRCRVCKASLEDIYGDLGREFIHVHHLIPIAEIGHEHRVDPSRDLCPVCPNCHAMLHRMNPPLAPEELAKRMRSKRRASP